MNPELATAETGLRPGQDVPPEGQAGLWLDDVELLMGLPLGHVRTIPELVATSKQSPRRALEQAIRPALLRPPCVITFSGGRDSSTVLAVAVELARKEGHPMPIPITHRYPSVPDSDESDWQELVIKHLRVDEWSKLIWEDEMDAVGPYARRVLRSLGRSAPFNQHTILPVIDAARGGSVVTGIGGDELFVFPIRRILNRALYRSKRLRAGEVKGLLAQASPVRMRRRRLAHAHYDLPWLTEFGRTALASRLAASYAPISVRYDRALTRWWWRDRTHQVCKEQLRRLAAEQQVNVVSPFTSGAVVGAMASRYGPAGPNGRAPALRELVGDLLPAKLLTRATKAGFDAAFAREEMRAFAQNWSGNGLDETLVRSEVLVDMWKDPEPDARIFSLLQAAWLADNPQ